MIYQSLSRPAPNDLRGTMIAYQLNNGTLTRNELRNPAIVSPVIYSDVRLSDLQMSDLTDYGLRYCKLLRKHQLKFMLIKVPAIILFLEIFALSMWNIDADMDDVYYFIFIGLGFLLTAIILSKGFFKCMGPRLSTMLTTVLSYYAIQFFLIVLMVKIDDDLDKIELFVQATSGIILVIDILVEFVMMYANYKKNKKINPQTRLPMVVKLQPGFTFREYVMQRKSERSMILERELLSLIIINHRNDD